MKFVSRFASALVAAATLALPEAARACSTCFGGDPTDPMLVGAKSGIIFMLVLIYALLFTMGGVVFMWWKNSKKAGDAEAAEGQPGTETGSAFPSDATPELG